MPGTTGFLLSPTTIHGVLLATEALHAALHSKVLFGLGTPYTQKQLFGRVMYFIWDAMTVFLSALALGFPFRAAGSRPARFLLFLSGLQLIQHTWYVVYWGVRAKHVKEIVEWSAIADNKMRLRKLGMARHRWHFWSTAFDAGVHAVMAAVHVAWFLGRW